MIIDIPVTSCRSLKVTIASSRADDQRLNRGALPVYFFWSRIALAMQQNKVIYAVARKLVKTLIHLQSASFAQDEGWEHLPRYQRCLGLVVVAGMKCN
jgi:hypothetical protein